MALKLTPEQQKVKARLQRYLNYKAGIKAVAMSQKFEIPSTGMEIIFWMETKFSKRWGHPHTQVPDIDNLLKAVMDGITYNDGHVAEVKMGKYWTKPGHGRIEIYINPNNHGPR